MDNVIDIYELSPMQQGMLFHAIYEADSGVYFEQRSCLIEGELNTNYFKQAWQQVIERHAILRTAFYWEDLEKPLQVVMQDVELLWIEKDWSNLTELEQKIELEKYLEDNRFHDFQLTEAPLMRCSLIKLANQKYRFIWSHHHILMDGWCNGILLREVIAIYKALNRKEIVNLTTPTPYRNYITWLQEQDKDAAINYWQESLKGFSEVTYLGNKKRNLESNITADFQTKLSTELTSKLNSFATQNRITINTIIQAAWALLISRYNDTNDIIFGAVVSGRPSDLANVESIVGLFINTLPVRVQLTPNFQIIEWLQQLQEQQITREQYSYSSLVEIQQQSTISAEKQIFDNLVIFENYPISLNELLNNLKIDFTLSNLQGFEKTNYPLTLYVIPGKQLTFRYSYYLDYFDEIEIGQISDRLTYIITQIIELNNTLLSDISLISEQEKVQLLTHENITNYPQDKLLPHLFTDKFQDLALANKTALVTQSENLTYLQLEQRVNQLANYLQSLGIQQRSLVGIYLDRDSDLIISLLAILKIGAVYISLDPNFPSKRIEYIINDTQLQFIIKKGKNDDFENSDRSNIIDLIKAQNIINRQNTIYQIPNIQPQDLAYIIYTSGSTGKPKGIAIQHNSLLNFLYALQQQIKIKKSDRLLAVTTVSFDIAALEIYLPLITGATVVLADRETTLDGNKMSSAIADKNITIMQATPATWQMLIDSNWQGKADFKILCGGEALSYSLATKLKGLSQQVWNLYGPTETTIWSSCYQFEDDHKQEQNTVSIGKEIANTQFYILDSHLNLVPQGFPGELYIGGAGLARGYYNRGDLTAERFIPNPVGANGCSPLHYIRLYKTGDKARQLPDGNFEYLGRLDNQVKIRGFRIELGEIETVLDRHPQVKNTVVVPYQQNLVAYIILDAPPLSPLEREMPKAEGSGSWENQNFDSQALRQYLTDKLPNYMIPSRFVVVDAFPLTPNNKVDRKALINNLSQQKLDSNTTENILTPTNSTEEILLGIWTEILERKQISIDDNFFELGGHSLIATRVISQVRQIFSLELPLKELFDNPTIRDLAKAIASTKQDESLPPIEVIDRQQELPLSFAQQRQWFLSQLEPDNPWYNITTAIAIQGDLDITRLEACFNILIQQREILRTAFLNVEGKPQLVIQPESKLNLEIIDLSNIDSNTKRQQIEQIQIAEAQQVFDLGNAPLMRVKAIALNSSEHILLVSFHHIIADGWSIGVLVEKIVRLYVDPPQPPLLSGERDSAGGSIQYIDYAAWQRKLLQGDFLEQQLDYWQTKLADAPVISSFATDFPRTADRNPQGAFYKLHLNNTHLNKLKRISQGNNSTLFITLFSATALFLHRYTEQTDLVIGTPVANRGLAEIENLIGFFANTLALRVNLNHNPTFDELLTQVRKTVLEAYRYQELPFEQLVDSLQLQRSLSHTPLFQVMVVLHRIATKPIVIDGLTWKPLPRKVATAKFEIIFYFTESDRGLETTIEYDRSLFTADTIHRLAGHFRNLLKSIIATPDAKISNLAIISKQEQQIFEQLNPPQQEPPIDVCIHQLFEEQVELYPDNIAVVEGAESITYRELSDRAKALAAHLQSLGISLEEKIGLLCDRSINSIIAILAILKAGGAYVPLDPNYPKERLDYIIEDTQLNILLTQTKYVSNFTDLNIVTINICKGDSRIAPTAPAPLHFRPKNLAYIMYTSGSTGKPKGVAVTHQGVVRLVSNPNYVKLNPNTVSLHAAPLSFDASTFEIWSALLNGGKLVILGNALPSLAEIAATITDYRVNTMWLTAGLFHLMIEEQIDAFSGVTQLLAGGDILAVDKIEKFLQAHPNCNLINGYGPTETTTFACCYRMDWETEIDKNRSIIGYPISQTQLYILDSYLNPLPVGVVGELYIGGAGIARSYLNNPQLTAEKFIPNPFLSRGAGEQGTGLTSSAVKRQNQPLSRGAKKEKPVTLYKAGDRAKQLPDGRIEYLGRIDNQVKIRGFRVEIGEIEAVLNRLPSVKSSVVVIKQDEKNNKQLIAYIILNYPSPDKGGWGDRTSQKIRQNLTKKLPDYLIPSIFIKVDDFPLTANGKVDRKALSNREIVLKENSDRNPQDITEIEIQLIAIWSKVLNNSTITVRDNFFSLGGDSILALQIVAKANQVGLNITPKDIFQYQTIAELALVVTSNKIGHAEQGLVTGEIPLTPIQKWFFELNLANVNYFNQSVLLEIDRQINLAVLEQAVEQLIAHHDALRIKFKSKKTGWQQYNYRLESTIKIETIDLSDSAETKLESAIIAKANLLQASLNIESGETIKIAYFQLPKTQKDRLLIIIHHLLIDGISWRILLEDLETAIEQISSNQDVKLPNKTVSYQQWSNYLQNYAKSKQFRSDIEYWLNKKNDLRDSNKAISNILLPISNSSSPSIKPYPKIISTTLDKESTQVLLTETNQTFDTQINDILLTALALTFAEYTQQSSLLLDLESQGRISSDIELDVSRTVGWFTNIYPLEITLKNRQNIAESLKEVKKQLAENKKYSFNYSILRYLKSQLQQLPQAEICFNYLGEFDNLLSNSHLFNLISESSIVNCDRKNRQRYLIEINSTILNQKLIIKWNYNLELLAAKIVNDLSNSYLKYLKQIISLCKKEYSLVDLKKNNLESIIEQIELN